MTIFTGLNGTQIKTATIPWSAMATGAIVPMASIINSSQIILSTGAVSMGASLAMGSHTITGLASPVNSTDAATKLYVDSKVSGFSIYGARALAATNVTTSGLGSTMDGVTLSSGDIVLLTNQTVGAQNGPWVAGSGAWTRPTWWASAAVVPEGTYFLIDPDGSVYKNTKWWMSTTGTITVDTTTTTFVQDLSGSIYTAGNGLSLVGGQFSVAAGNGITAGGGTVTAVGTGIITVGASGIAISNSSANGQLIVGNASNVPTWTAMSGDATLGATGGLTLATVNSNTGAFGSSTAIPSFTVNAKGLITAASTNAVVAPASTLTGTTLASGVVTSSLTSVGTLGSLSVSGTATFTGAPVLTALTGFVYANGGSAVTAATTIPTTALKLAPNEVPAGTCDGSNTTFTLAHSPVSSSLVLSMNGMILRPGGGYDYTISGATITTTFAPASVDYLMGTYFY